MRKRFVKTVFGVLIITWAFQVMSVSAFAQLSPPINPWLGMSNRNRASAVLGPYLGVVKPQQDLIKAYAAQSGQIQSQQQALRDLQGGNSGGSFGVMDFSAANDEQSDANKKMILAPPQEIPKSQRNPAAFNQYLHYYPPNSLLRYPVPYFSPTGRRR